MNDGGWNPQGTLSSGTLKAKITLKGFSPFYCLKPELPPKSTITGSTDLLSAYEMGSVYTRFCGNKKIREDLASFLPSVYGNFNINPAANDISSLRRLIEKPPITGKEIQPLSTTSLNGFKLNAGPVDDRYSHLFEKKPILTYPNYEHDPKTGLNRHKTTLEPLAELDEDGNKKKVKVDKKEKKRKKEKRKKEKKEEKEREKERKREQERLDEIKREKARNRPPGKDCTPPPISYTPPPSLKKKKKKKHDSR